MSIESITPATGARRRILEDASQPRYLPSGELLYYQHGALMSVPFDVETLTASGEPRKVHSPLAGGEVVPRPRYAVSAAGTFAFLPAPTSYEVTELAWSSLDGSVTPACKTEEPIDSLRLSPDGGKVAYAAGTVISDIWVRDLARLTTTRIAAGGRRYYPVWTPDGRRVAFKTEGPGTIDWVAADGTSQPETLFAAQPDQRCYPNSFTPDAATLIFTLAERPDGPDDLFAVQLSERGEPSRVFAAPAYANRFGARLSPDGSLLAYTSEESGAMEVYVQPYPALDRKIPVSSGGGFRSAWSGDGKSLFYRSRDRLYEVSVTRTPELSVSSPRLLLEHLPESRYDAAPDGKRFLIAQLPGGSAPETRINVILNWDRELGLGGPK